MKRIRTIHITYRKNDIEYIAPMEYTYTTISNATALMLIQKTLKKYPTIKFISFKNESMWDSEKKILKVRCTKEDLNDLFFELNKTMGKYLDQLWF